MKALIQTTLLAATLHSLSQAQTVQISDLVAGERAVISVTGLNPRSQCFVRWKLGDAHPLDARPLAVRLHSNSDGVAQMGLDLPNSMIGLPLVAETLVFSGPGTFTSQSAGAFVQAPGALVSTRGDAFNGTALDSTWSLLHPALMSFQVAGGALHITPTRTGPDATWFNDGEGPFIYKTFVGNFDARSTVHAESSMNPGTPVPLQFRLGGLMVRDSASAPGNRNSAHIAIGSGSAGFAFAVEDKTTTGSISDFFFHSVPSQNLSLRITRVGDLISRYYRVPGAALWTLMRADAHPEFASTVQVGMMAYSFDNPVDIRASFDGIQFH